MEKALQISRLLALSACVMTACFASDAHGQLFQPAEETASHRVIDTDNLALPNLPSMIQSALLKKLEQHIESGKQIDHDRLAQILDSVPIDEQTRATVKNMAKIISPSDLPTTDDGASLPEGLNEVIRQQYERFNSRQTSPANALAPSLDSTAFKSLLDFNRRNGGFRAPGQSNPYVKMDQRFQEGRNKSKRSTWKSNRQRKSTKPHRARVSAAPSNTENRLTKKLFESAIEAMDQSSMDFLKATKDGDKKLFSGSWFKKANRTWKANVRKVNRAFTRKRNTNVSNAVSNFSLPNNDDNQKIWSTAFVVAMLALSGALLRKRLANRPETERPTQKEVTFPISSIKDRSSLIRGVNSVTRQIMGTSAETKHHAAMFDHLHKYESSARRLAPVYARCRYAPDEDAQPGSEDLEFARQVLLKAQNSFNSRTPLADQG